MTRWSDRREPGTTRFIVDRKGAADFVAYIYFDGDGLWHHWGRFPDDWRNMDFSSPLSQGSDIIAAGVSVAASQPLDAFTDHFPEFPARSALVMRPRWTNYSRKTLR